METSSDSRGRVTLFEGAIPALKVTRAGVSRPANPVPVWSRVKAVHFVMGGTLERVAIVDTHGRDAMTCIVHMVPESQRAKHCDKCPKTHRTTNAACSANLGIDTYASTPGTLYDINTGRTHGRWRHNGVYRGTSKTCLADFVRT